VRQSLLVREPARYALRELSRRPVRSRYRLRASPSTQVVLRHDVGDSYTFEEIFVSRSYALPERARRALSGEVHLKVADLGANVGLFSLFLFGEYPDARIVAFEPDPENAAVAAACMDLNGRRGQWELVQACAGTRDGEVAFASTRSGLSLVSPHVVDAAADGDITVSTRDVFPLLADVDLIKIDIEGGEWDLLSDPRFSALPARALALEYHPHLCPAPDPRTLVTALLRGAGWELHEVFHNPDPPLLHGSGMFWAWRAAPSASSR
jgi:FkbM family methyltransferase